MKKILGNVFGIVLGISLFMGSYFTSYTAMNNILDNHHELQNVSASVIAVDKKTQLKSITAEEVIKEEQPVEEESTSATTNYQYNGGYNNYQVSGNSIQVGGVIYSTLLKDWDGSQFYLNHDINGNYDGRGVPFIDYRTNFNTRKTLIYAHSMPNGNGPFQALQNYHYNKGFYDANRYITINYEGNTYTYEIFSVYVSTASWDYDEGLEYYYKTNYSDEDWNNAIQRYKANSEYDTGVSVSGSDKILILQTCSMDPNYFEKYYRYNLVVMAKLI